MIERHTLRRTLIALAVASGALAIVIAIDVGIAASIGSLTLKSHRAMVPAAACAVLVLTVVAVWSPRRAADDLDAAWRGARAAWARGAVVASLATFAVAVRYGTFAASGADAYGYVSQAELWLHGTLRVTQSIATAMPWPDADWTFSPLGYRPVPPPGTIVPTYPPGLPMLMAAASAVTGAQSVYFVVPLCGALAVWLTFVLGRVLNDGRTGMMAAALVCVSPVFLFQIVQPLSDVPATAAWLAALVLALRSGKASAVTAGVAAGCAALIRPNLAPLVMIPAALVFLRDARADSSGAPAVGVNWRRVRYQGVVSFLAGLTPGVMAIAAIHVSLYGSPFASGYGDLDALFAIRHFAPNLRRYSVWALETQTPVIALALLAPFVLRRHSIPRERIPEPEPRTPEPVVIPRATLAWTMLAFAAAVVASYLLYSPFEEWWYLRFLLPALPPVLVLSSAVIVTGLARLPRAARFPAFAIIVAVLGASYFRIARDRGALGLQALERRYVAVGDYVAQELPARAVPFAVQQSGSVRYYSGRTSLRWDHLEPAWLERAIATLDGRGYPPYFLLEDWEEPAFKARFARASVLGRLDWPPVAEIKGRITIRIYDPADRARFLSGERLEIDRRYIR